MAAAATETRNGKRAEMRAEMQAHSAELLAEVFRNYGRAAGVLDPNRLEVWEGLGLTFSQLRVMSLLSNTRFALAGTIAEALKVRPSTATGIVDRLVRQELVVRQRDQEDRRCVRISLTPHGRRVISDLRERNLALLERLFQRFTQDEIATIARAFELVTEEGERLGLIMPWPPETGSDDSDGEYRSRRVEGRGRV